MSTKNARVALSNRGAGSWPVRLWCTHHASPPRPFTAEQVNATIRRVPAFAQRAVLRLVPAVA